MVGLKLIHVRKGVSDAVCIGINTPSTLQIDYQDKNTSDKYWVCTQTTATLTNYFKSA